MEKRTGQLSHSKAKRQTRLGDAPLREVHACPNPATDLPRHSILGRRRWSVCDKQVQSEHLGHPKGAVHEAFTQSGGAESERRFKSVKRQRPFSVVVEIETLLNVPERMSYL